eukprot:764499-Hanusia_phi.AAC.5
MHSWRHVKSRFTLKRSKVLCRRTETDCISSRSCRRPEFSFLGRRKFATIFHRARARVLDGSEDVDDGV